MKKLTLILGIVILIVILLACVYSFQKKNIITRDCKLVASWNIDECCETWTSSHNIFVKPDCSGKWTFSEGNCRWVCDNVG